MFCERGTFMPRILIGSDLCPVGRSQIPFAQGQVNGLFNDLVPFFKNSDLAIVNLECPLIKNESPISKCGPNLGVPLESVNGIKALGIGAVNLANNHIMDHGPQGLATTIESLQDNDIAYIGAGKDLAEARKIWIKEVHGLRIGVLSLGEHEFASAERDKPGGNPLNVIDCVRNINEHRSKFDYLIVLLHGGNEFYQYPRPDIVELCRFLVEMGAKAVICQHTHCVGCMETHLGAPIIYGQGNLLFDMASEHKTWHEGILLGLDINLQGETQVEIIPYIQSDKEPGLRRMTSEKETHFLREFEERSGHLNDDLFLMERWSEFCEKTKRYHLHLLNHPPSIFRRVLGKLDLFHVLDSKEKRKMHLHILRCESLREAIITQLESELEK
jgi:poly-gamma-glutamate capsule biosynthesis protein CapA/YwtB (metallophosphatase superfamily)